MPRIRPTTAQDAATLARLADALNRHFGIMQPAFGADRIQPHMAGEDPLLFGYLLEDGIDALGYALCQKFFDTDSGTMATWLLDLYITDDLRGQGWGRKLLARVARDAAAKGQCCIGLAVYEDNPARHLYDRIGAALSPQALVYELRDGNLDRLAQEDQI